MMNVLIKKSATRITTKRSFRKDHSGRSWELPSNMNPLARAPRALITVIGLIRMVKFLVTTIRLRKRSINGHLFVVDIPSVVSQSDQAAFPSLAYSQERRRDQGRKEVSDRLRSVRGGDPL